MWQIYGMHYSKTADKLLRVISRFFLYLEIPSIFTFWLPLRSLPVFSG